MTAAAPGITGWDGDEWSGRGVAVGDRGASEVVADGAGFVAAVASTEGDGDALGVGIAWATGVRLDSVTIATAIAPATTNATTLAITT